VDNITYIWLGDPVVPDETNYYVTQTDYTYTATRSIFTMDVAGVVGMTITMTSPVLPDTILEMSLPYTYMDVQVNSIDGKEHDVQLYTDISAGTRKSTIGAELFTDPPVCRMGRGRPQRNGTMELRHDRRK